MVTNRKTEKIIDTNENMNTKDVFVQVKPDIKQQNEQSDLITQLRDSLNELTLAFQASQARNAQSAAFQDALTEIKSSARSLAMVNTVNGLNQSVLAYEAPKNKNDGCSSDCNCISSECCEFEIYIEKVRASRPQKLIEVADSGETSLPIPLINAMEVQIYATVEQCGVLIPSLGTTMDLRAEGGLNPGPGLYVTLNRLVNRVKVQKGLTKVINFEAEVREHDEGAERVLGFKDELGAASGSIALNCCMSEIYPSSPLEVNLDYGGNGGGSVQIIFVARKSCC